MIIKEIKLDKDELWPILNILNQVSNGLKIINFEKVIGANFEIVCNLMDRISREEHKESVILSLSALDVNIIKKSFEECLRQIDEWEFQTLIGISIPEAQLIQKKFITT